MRDKISHGQAPHIQIDLAHLTLVVVTGVLRADPNRKCQHFIADYTSRTHPKALAKGLIVFVVFICDCKENVPIM